jgi:hypothetical protein
MKPRCIFTHGYYAAQFLEIRDKDHDLLSFWLRKTKKLVLAVLLVEKPGQAPRLYRGTNMEVRYDQRVCDMDMLSS